MRMGKQLSAGALDHVVHQPGYAHDQKRGRQQGDRLAGGIKLTDRR